MNSLVNSPIPLNHWLSSGLTGKLFFLLPLCQAVRHSGALTEMHIYCNSKHVCITFDEVSFPFGFLLYMSFVQYQGDQLRYESCTLIYTCVLLLHIQWLACTLLGQYSLSFSYLLFSQRGYAPLGSSIIRCGNSVDRCLYRGTHEWWWEGVEAGQGPCIMTTAQEERQLDSETKSSYPWCWPAGGPSLRGRFYLLLLFGNELSFF